MPRDPYEVLGVSKSATPEEINKAHRKLSKKYHPDRNPGDKQADANYKEVQTAHDILGDPDKKAQYDQFGFAGTQSGFPGAGGGFPGGGFPGGGFPGGGGQMDPEAAQRLFDMFGGGAGGPDLSDLFGGGRRKTRSRSRPRAEPIESDVTIPFDVAANGGSVGLEFGGRHIDVKVPAGIEEGKRLRVPADATGGQEVLLRVKIAPHPFFRREGNDLYLDVPLTIAEAVLGAKVDVPTLDGSKLALVTVTVPPGTSSGRKLRLRGKGVAGGDQYLVFKVEVPSGSVDEKSRELITEFAQLNPQSPRANAPWV
ncbi:Curved DNA-binding protein [Gemmata obscuriglobus]|uniref:J domain-containing protein n=1 Tax=Gemmata obscuriglobus TaxID=114 RepID=A0A2Z3HJ90_9BACT|nr:J domain-containing protein [Gemmata obscuriglobus]AWM41530.1 J domain-containing protein [Gemmata obscuriglobus]QEG32560.1 Curved DNA-binding protein [Gemmata obscuriglobus]VTS11916.1 molecular chaperone : Heat shock protein DnaJ-like protein OS=Planctomyces maris DSM 8797 GN=PM8797T_24486 PE=4 SV=1: DnaJ: CTDII [Gemmata obscuriglobus UQM 2246]